MTKKLLLFIYFCLSFNIYAQEKAFRITNKTSVLINENQRVRIKIKHPRKNRSKKVSGQFQFSKNKDSIFIQSLTRSYKIALSDIIKIKKYPLAMYTLISAGTILYGGTAIWVSIVVSALTGISSPFLVTTVIALPLIIYQVFIRGINPLKGYHIKNGYSIKATADNNLNIGK